MQARGSASLSWVFHKAGISAPLEVAPFARKARSASGGPQGGRRVLTGPPLPFSLPVVVAFGRAPRGVEKSADQDVRSRANAEVQ